MVTRSTIKDWFVNHTKPIQKVMNTLDHTDVVFMPVKYIARSFNLDHAR